MSLILTTSEFTNVKNPKYVKLFYMPDGQPHCEIDMPDSIFENTTQVNIITRPSSFDELGLLSVLVSTLRNYHDWPIVLIMTYPFGGRQDRKTRQTPLTAKIVADFINRLGFHSVEMVHPHSDVLPALINNSRTMFPHEAVSYAVENYEPTHICIPDLGAAKHIKHFAKYNKPIIRCGKTRDFNTGKLSGFEVIDQMSMPIGEFANNAKFLIVDDICDGGGTFIGLSSLLKKEWNIGSIGLYCTHGIFSKGFKPFVSHIDKIYTTNTYSQSICKSVEDEKFLDLVEVCDLL